MDSFYPEDILVGFFPLVFAVNAIHEAEEEAVAEVASVADVEVMAAADQGNGKQQQRTLFDRFLDAIAASLVDESEELVTSSDGHQQRRSTNRNTMSLFRSDDDDDESSDEEGDVLHEYFSGNGGGGIQRKKSGGFYAGFGRRAAAPVVVESNSSHPNHSNNNDVDERARATSYARALTVGQGFFQRARIVTISPKYGFPPSKDPEGTQNLPFELQNLFKRRSGTAEGDKERVMRALFQQYPVSGIIASGWLQKHVHALPSVIMVVCTVSASQKEQAEQDRLLFQTIEHLQYSLVPKRQCSIQVVGLMKDDVVTDEQGEEWSQAITQDLVLEDNANTPFTVTVLRASTDLMQQQQQHIETTDHNIAISQTSDALRRLHRTARDASLLYYLRQARRTKDKLLKLVDNKYENSNNSKRRTAGPPPVQLSPLIVRYCFKIAIFYEFQMKHEKSLRFMAEAYRSIAKYYQWLLASRPAAAAAAKTNNSHIQSVDTLESGGDPHTDGETATRTMMASSPSVAESGDNGGVEVELMLTTSDNTSSEGRLTAVWSKVVPAPPEDILYQCRVVADWLNLKLLTSGFASHTEGGLLAAASQWRVHSRVFATRRHSAKLQMDDWFEWSYISRQRTVMSQLVERHPPKALGDLGNGFDEVVLRCSPWRSYESAAEAMLRLAREVEKAQASGKYSLNNNQVEKNDAIRARYVGGLSTDGLRLDFDKECAVKHRDKALEMILRAISIFEHELMKDKRGFYAEDELSERSSSRTGAHLHYLAGGILLGMGRHEDSAGHLSKASRYSRGWRELELAVRRMLIECYEKHIPSQSEASESSETLVSMILDSYFNAEMSSQDLRKALDHFAAMSGGDTLKWYHETRDEEDSSLPFSFAVSFPGKTHATSGDTVEASVVIKSNLDYAIHVNSVALATLAGKLCIPANDLLSAVNASEGSEGGIIIQAKTAIIVSTKLELPKDLSAIAFDDSGNGGELSGVAGKGSFAKNAKPRTAGITSAGGARLVSEEMLQRGNSNSQGWNVRFLGGKPLLCDGLHLTFYPVQAEKVSAENMTLIELTIEKKKMRTAANIKRTPFEEENYIASAWSRPQHLPFSRGPRSLRVLGPQPELVITNVTDAMTNGKALEGTVNRILLKLQAGAEEYCSDLNLAVSCFSVLITPSGSTKRLVSKDELSKEAENSVDMRNPCCRTPILVKPAKWDGGQPVSTDLGYDLPARWQAAGSGQTDNAANIPSLKGGESSFVHLDFFRPAAYAQRQVISADGIIEDDDLGDLSLCKTDFYVTLTYRQKRPSAQNKKQTRTRRLTRTRPVMTSTTKENAGEASENTFPNQQMDDVANEILSDKVSLEFMGSIVWNPPIAAKFTPGASKGYPSGSRHPSNTLIDGVPRANTSEEYVLVDGDRVSTRCSLQLDPSMEGLQMEIVSVRFEDNAQPEHPVTVSLVSNDVTDDGSVIYRSELNEPCRMLSTGAKFCISYTVRAKLKDEVESRSVSSSLGSILVDWRPSTLDLPNECVALSPADGIIKAHGPLALDSPSTIRFTGQRCYVERTPFKVKPLNISSPLAVATPFEVKYRITNTTSIHQMIRLEMHEVNSTGEGYNAAASGLLLSGCMSGQLSLGPLEEQTVSFTVIATRPGETTFPALRVSSDRYKSWIIKDGPSWKRLYIFP